MCALKAAVRWKGGGGIFSSGRRCSRVQHEWGEEVVFVVQPLVTLRAERYGGGIVFIEP